MIRRFSPAKLNLRLQVGSRLSSGYHQLETVMLPVSLGDWLAVSHRPLGVTLDVHERYDFAGHSDSVSKIPTDERNLVVRIARGFLDHCGVSTGVHFELWKSIPAGGGLGGASSNAAAALLLLNELFQLNWKWEQLAKFSEDYGSDIAFFTQPQAAVCTGRGENVSPFPCPHTLWLAIVRPPFGLSTPAVFGQLARERSKANVENLGSDVSPAVFRLMDFLQSGTRESALAEVTNDLQRPAVFLRPELGNIEEICAATHPLVQLMTGSGSCWFAVYRNRRQATWAANRLKGQLRGRVEVARTRSPGILERGQ